MYQKMLKLKYALGLVNVGEPGVDDLTNIMSGELTDIICEQAALIAEQGKRTTELEKKLARLEHEQKLNRVAMPFGGV